VPHEEEKKSKEWLIQLDPNNKGSAFCEDSRSYVYMSAGNISSKKEENSNSYGNDCSQDLRNYRSAFFEDD
jgi:hypothetical protein